MKDFDFDELDRAVNSVLATKDTKNAQNDQPTDDVATAATPSTEESSPVVVADHNDQPTENNQTDTSSSSIIVADDQQDGDDAETVMVNTTPSNDQSSENAEQHHEQEAFAAKPNDDESTDEQQDVPAETSLAEEDSLAETTDEPQEAEKEEKPPVDTAALAAIPVKRGRFMDVVAPSSSDNAKKAFPTRTGVTITPSANFSSPATTESSDNEAEEKPAVVSVSDPATPIVNEEVEPEVQSDTSTDSTADEVSNIEQPTSVDATPFIPDVPVEKRPLNDLSGDEEAQEPVDTSVSDEETKVEIANTASVDPTLSSNVPKEFDKEIMAVESNETVGENDETHADSTSDHLQTNTDTPAIAATTAEPHPMFDTSTLAHPGDVHGGHHTSKFSWAIIGGSLFVVGAALGVLYFLYGQG
jgi:hypothetical protein